MLGVDRQGLKETCQFIYGTTLESGNRTLWLWIKSATLADSVWFGRIPDTTGCIQRRFWSAAFEGNVMQQTYKSTFVGKSQGDGVAVLRKTILAN